MMRTLLLPLFLLAASVAHASDVDTVLAMSEPPPGVVFELVEGSEAAWDWALPRLTSDIERLRARFPGLPIAVVSHGDEQFMLMAERQAQREKEFRELESLVTDESVDLHVCGAYAYWNDVAPEAFAEFVDVTPSGPARINDYLALDYVHIVLEP